MNTRARLSRLSALSYSMPDVTGAGVGYSPAYFGPAHEIVEEGEEGEEEEEGSGRSVLRAEPWVDAVDPTSGSVFYVDSAPWAHHGSVLPRSSSSSSLSSISSSHPPLPSLTSSPLSHRKNHSAFSASLPPTPNEVFSPSFPLPCSTPQHSRRAYSMSHSALPSPAHSENMMGFFAPDGAVPEALTEYPSPCPSPSPSEGWLPKSHSTSSVGRSVRKKWKKIVRRGGKRSKKFRPNYSQRMVPSGSFPNLSSEADFLSRHEHERVPTQQFPPHGALYGSRGFPLAPDSHTSIISVRISLKPHPQAARQHRHWNLEKLGIVPARALGGRRHRSFTNLRLAFKNHYPTSTSPSSSSSPLTNSLVIRGIIPGTPASLSTQLQPGDTVLAVNGHSVNLDNANSVVRSSSDDELVLIVKKNTLYSSTLTSTPAHHHLHTSAHHSDLVRLVSGKEPSHRHHSYHSLPHLLLYLTLDTNEDDPADKDILYCYPKDALVTETDDRGEGREGREEVGRLLMQLRGVFLTLSDVMASITTDNKSYSTVRVMGRSFHLAHIQYHKEVLLLALPVSVLPPHLVLATAERVERTLRLLFGSPQSAFSLPDHHSTVDHLLTLLLHHLTPHSQPHPSYPHTLSVSPLTSLTAVPRQVFSVEATVRVSEALDSLEAVSPTHRMTDIAHAPRTLFPRGSFLFHQGRLVQSHLPPSELEDVVVFCQAYRLLEVSCQDPRSSIVVWRELHLSGQSSSVDDSKLSGRVFLLLVGLDHMIVGLVMDGCGLTPEATPTLDPVYVNEAKHLIAKLDAQDIFSTCIARVATATPIPAVMSLDRVLATHLSTPFQSPIVSLHPRHLALQQHTSVRGSDTEEEDDSMPTHSSRSMMLPSFLPRGKRKVLSQVSINQAPLLTGLAIRQNYTLTAGDENILLHYLCVEVGQGVWLGPTHKDVSPCGTIHSEMITCFQTTCTAIRTILLESDAAEEESDDEEWDWDSEEEHREQEEKPSPFPFSQPPPGGRCVEHGVLLEVPLKHFATDKQLKTTPSLRYWVVGRLFPDCGRELYVCFEESTSQTMVELAFKLLFATNS